MSTPFLGGALKLKGDSAAIGKKTKKKKKAKNPAADEENKEEEQQQQRAAEDAAAAAAAPPPPDRRTEAERRRDAQLARVEEERLRKAAEGKGYRERVAEYNDKLAALSEHHDIPRVGPG